MILPIAFIIGFVLGWWRSSARRGALLDKLQFGAAHGIAFLLVALVVTIILDRMGYLRP